MKMRFFILLACLAGVMISGQTPADSTHTDARPQPAKSADTLRYSASAIRYEKSESLLILIDSAVLKNGDMTLKADTILFHTNTRTLEAMGHPILVDAGGTLIGERMIYRIDEKRGKILYGTARSQGDRYNGQTIGRMEDQSILVKNGDFTTCDNDSAAHFFFYCENMKIVPQDKVIAKPVVLNIGEVPVGVFPYFVFPIKHGRQSGLLTPRYGEFSDHGARAAYLNNIGYYFAINDYTDLTTRMDFSNGDGYFFQKMYLNTDFSYNKRYWLDGYLNGRFNVSRSDEATAQDYGLSYSHNQNLTPDKSFYVRGSGQIIGNSNYYRESTFDRADYLKRRLTSNMAVVKSWNELGLSTNLNASYSEDLDTKENQMELPAFSFSSIQRPLPFARQKDEDGIALPSDSLRWYEKIRYQYSLTGKNIYQKERKASLVLLDTTQDTSTVYRRYQANDMRHNLNFSLSPAPKLGYVNISPFLSTSSNWFFKEKRLLGIQSIDTIHNGNATAYDTTLLYDTIAAFNHREDYSTGIGLSTTLYGTRMLHWGPLLGFRHVVNPNVTYTFSPELKHGERYVSAGTASNGNRDKQQHIGFGAGNTYQMKLQGDPEDKNSKDKSVTLLNLNVGTGYNFTGKNKAGDKTGRWDDLGSSASTSLYALDFNYSGTHSFYDAKDRFIPTHGKKVADRLPRLRRYNLSANTGASLSGRFSDGSLNAALNEPDTAFMTPWRFTLGFGYTFTKAYNDAFQVFETGSTFSLRDNLDFNFSKNWFLTYSSYYDFGTNELVDQTLHLRRDLHCWEAVFDWVISGYRAGYYFRINIKKLQDVKFEKRGGAFGPYSGSGFTMPLQNYY